MISISYYWIVIILLIILIIIILLSKSISSKTLAVLINIIALYGTRSFQKFHINEIGFFPLRIVGLELETYQSRKKPKITLQWDLMTVSIEWRSLSGLQGLISLIAQTESFFGSILRYISKITKIKINNINLPTNSNDNNDTINATLVRIKFDNFSFSSPDLQFKHVLQSSSDNIYDKENQNTLLSQCKGSHSYIMTMIVKQVSSLFEIEFNKISFNLNMQTHQAVINGGASRIRMHTSASGSLSSYGLLGICHIYKGIIIIIIIIIAAIIISIIPYHHHQEN